MAADVNDLNQRWEALRTKRSSWDVAWDDLSRHFLPFKFRSDMDSDAGRKPEILNKKIVDTTGILDMRTLAAGMQGGMTSPVRPWFKITLEDEEAAKQHEAGEWLDEVSRRMLTLLHNSNFYNSIHGLYADLGTFGTALMLETADWTGLNFQLVRAGEYVLDVNDKNEVDTFFRRMLMSARQILLKFGEQNVPEAVKNAAKNRNATAFDQRFEVIHGVFPRRDPVYGKLGGGNMPFASVYWMRFSDGGGKPHLLRESGAIEQDADIVMFLHAKKANQGLARMPVRAIVAKGRSSGTGAANLLFDKPFSDFVEDTHADEWAAKTSGQYAAAGNDL